MKWARKADNEIAVLDTSRWYCRACSVSIKVTVFFALRMRPLVLPTSRGTRRMTERCKKESRVLESGLKEKKKMHTRRNAVATACRATFVATEAAGPGLALPDCKRLNEDLRNAFQFAHV